MSVSAKIIEKTKLNKSIDHPAANEIATYADKILVSDLNGFVTLYKNDKKLERWKTSKKNLICRSAQWLDETNFLAITENSGEEATAGKRTNKRETTGSIVQFDVNSHIQISTTQTKYTKDLRTVCPVTENLFLTGNDSGRVAFYDKRKKMNIPLFYDNDTHSDYISDISVEGVHGGRYAHCTSGDGTMSTFNLRKNKLFVVSENEVQTDYLSVCCLDEAKRVVVGSQMGELLLFNYGEYGCSSDRIPGHPGTVDTVIEYSSNNSKNANIILTAGEDAAIRALSIAPHRYLGIVGRHEKDDSILRLSLLGDGNSQNDLISLGQEGLIKFWNLNPVNEIEEVDSTEKVLGKLKGTASLVNSEKHQFLKTIEGDKLEVPADDKVQLSDSSEWEDDDDDESSD